MDRTRPAIRLVGLTKVFEDPDAPAVHDLDLEVATGHLVALVGPSGCGKTTTLKMINRLIEPTSGTIEIDGTPATDVPVHQLRRHIGYVIQNTGLFPHKTVADNIATVPRLFRWDRARIKARVAELVELLGLDADLLDRYPAALSGGQQQRVGVARALAADPPVMLMDEPYSAVDPIVRARLQDELLALQRTLHKTIVFVTHDIDEAIKLADRIVIMNVGGIIEQEGAPVDVLADPASPFVADFLGAERGLKRLALLTVADVEPVDGPVVEEDAAPGEAQALMADHGVDWVGVRRDGQMLGWAWRDALDGVARVGDAERHPFRAVIGGDTSLRKALDGLLSARTNVAVVEDAAGRYLGMVTVAEISDRIRRDAPDGPAWGDGDGR